MLDTLTKTLYQFTWPVFNINQFILETFCNFLIPHISTISFSSNYILILQTRCQLQLLWVIKALNQHFLNLINCMANSWIWIFHRSVIIGKQFDLSDFPYRLFVQNGRLHSFCDNCQKIVSFNIDCAQECPNRKEILWHLFLIKIRFVNAVGRCSL